MKKPVAAPVLDPKQEWFQEGHLALPPDLEYEAWQLIGDHLKRMERNVGFWLGDWWRYGEHRYGQRASQASDTGFALKTLQNAARVAERIEPSRRREDVTFSHHEAVAGRPPEEQDKLLAEAAAGQWPVQKIRAEVRHLRAADTAEPVEAWSYRWICYTCPGGDIDGPHFDCPRPGETTFDRGYLCNWLGDHRHHDIRFLDTDQLAARARIE